LNWVHSQLTAKQQEQVWSDVNQDQQYLVVRWKQGPVGIHKQDGNCQEQEIINKSMVHEQQGGRHQHGILKIKTI
jgi:hypothetical protein